MESNAPWAPLAIMLSMYGSRISSKLLFKYPFESGRYSQTSLSSYKQLTSSTFHLNHSNVSVNDAEESEEVDVVRDEVEQYLGFSDETLAHILSPGNSKICGQKFDVKINGLRFVGFPLMPEYSNIETNRVLPVVDSLKSNSVPQRHDDPNSNITVLSFNIVFVLKTTANYGVVEAYQQLAAKLGVGLRFEEKRTSYITREIHSMLNIHDEDSEFSKEQIYQRILKKSCLAQNLRHVFDSLENTGIIHMSLNNNLRISFCLHQKVHNCRSQHCGKVNITGIEKCLTNIQPFHGLLVYDIKNVWESLTDYCSMSMVKFLNVYKPTKSLQLMSTDADIALRHVFTIAKHLVLWGKACVIYPLCETNVYILAPSASLFHQSRWVTIFVDKFNLNLTEVLNYFSTPIRLGDYQSPTGPFFGNEKKLVDILIWLLQHRFLLQHHTYIYFLPPQKSGEMSSSDLKQCLLDHLKKGTSGKVDFQHLPHSCKTILHDVTASRDPNDLTLFLKLLKYFDGKHHLEEMMYRENIVRHQLVTVLEKFKPLLLSCVREDEIAAAFCMPK